MGAPDLLLRGAFCLALGCGKSARDTAQTPLEAAIDRELTQRFGVGVVTTCTGTIPPCIATLGDGTALPIDLQWSNAGWDWRVKGLVITTDQLEAYLRDEVAELGAPQGVRCAPRVRAIAAGDRIECWLARGGKAFVTVAADGRTSVEIALEPGAANVRSEVVTPAREAELEATSRALAHMADDEDEDGEPPADAAPADSPTDANDPR